MKTHRAVPALAACLVLIVCGVAHADVAQVGAWQDNTLYEDATGSFSNGAGDHFFAGQIAAGLNRRGLIAFDIASSVPAGATITGVTLTLHMSRTIAGDTDITLHRMLADWGEGASDAPGEEGGGAPAAPGDATWIHAFFDTTPWIAAGGDFDLTPSATQVVGGEGFYEWTNPQMIGDVQGWLDDPGGNFGWLVLGDESTPVTAKRFDTRENPDAAVRPVLTIEFTPVPTPGVLGILGCAGLFGGAGRRRR